MKIKDGFMIREVAGQWVAVPLADRVIEFNGLMTLSETGAMIWQMMADEVSEDEIVQALMAEYTADEATIRGDVREFVISVREKDLLEETPG